MNLGIGLGVTNYLRVPTVAINPDDLIAALFSSGEEGAWYDPSDLTTLYQDSKGLTPVTGTGQPVGLMLDKSKGLTLGSELVINGTFDTDTDWTKGTGWTIAGGVATHAVGTASNLISALPVVTAGKTHQVSITVSGMTPGPGVSVSIYSGLGGSGNSHNIAANGSHSVILIGGTSDQKIYIQGSSTFDGSVDNISVKELPGNHATQSTSTARPTLQLSGSSYYLDFDGVDDLMRAQYGTTLSDITRGVAYRADADNKMVADDYDGVNFAGVYALPGGTDLRFRINSSATDLVIGSGGWLTGDDEVAIAQALSDGSISLQGSGNAASNTVSAPTGINGVTLGAAGSGVALLDGRIYGFVDVDRGLNADEITSVENYLADKTGAFTAPVITGVPTISVS